MDNNNSNLQNNGTDNPIPRSKFNQYRQHAHSIIDQYLQILPESTREYTKKLFDEKLEERLKNNPDFTLEKLETSARTYAEEIIKLQTSKEKSFSLVVSTDAIKKELIIQGMDPKEVEKFMDYHSLEASPTLRNDEQYWNVDKTNESLQKWNAKYKISGLEQAVEKIPKKAEDSTRETLLTEKEFKSYLSEISDYAAEYVKKEVAKHPDIFQKNDKYRLEPIKDLIIRGLIKGKSKEEGIDFARKKGIPESSKLTKKLIKTPLADQFKDRITPEEPEEIQVEPVSEEIIRNIEEDKTSYEVSGTIETIYKLAQEIAGKGPITDITIQKAVIEYGIKTGQIKRKPAETKVNSKVEGAEEKLEEILTAKPKEEKMVRTSPIGRPNPRGDPSKYNVTKSINIKGGTYISLAAAFIATLALIFNLDIDYSRLAKELKKDKAVSTLVEKTVEDKLKPYKPKDKQKITDDAQNKRLSDIENNYKTLLENTSNISQYVENIYKELKQQIEQSKQPQPSIDHKELEQLQQIQSAYKLIREELKNIWSAQFAAGEKIAELKREIEKKSDKEEPQVDLEQRLDQLTEKVEELTTKYETVKTLEEGFKKYLEQERVRTTRKTTFEPIQKQEPPKEEQKPKEIKEEKPKKPMSKADKYRKMLRDRKKK